MSDDIRELAALVERLIAADLAHDEDPDGGSPSSVGLAQMHVQRALHDSPRGQLADVFSSVIDETLTAK